MLDLLAALVPVEVLAATLAVGPVVALVVALVVAAAKKAPAAFDLDPFLLLIFNSN